MRESSPMVLHFCAFLLTSLKPFGVIFCRLPVQLDISGEPRKWGGMVADWLRTPSYSNCLCTTQALA